MRRIGIFLLVIMLAAAGTASADSVTQKHFVCLNWVGEYTGQVDSNGVPFGYGVFVSDDPINNTLWHYIGVWENGVPQGEGAMYFEDGTIHKGLFSGGELVDGKIYTANGLTVTAVKLERAMEQTEAMYIGNKKSMRFHLPTCRSVTQMSEKNKVEFSSRDEAIEHRYIPCGECNP